MDHDFWRERWAQGQLGFHRLDTNPMLERFWPALEAPQGRVLVPLCGKSLDLDWLAGRGHEVVGVEFVAAAVDAYFAERAITPLRSDVDGVSTRHHAGVSLVIADFFRVRAEVTGVCDAVYDRGAFVAIAPEDRGRYVQTVRSLLRPGARVLLVNFAHDLGTGPPHSIAPEEIRALWHDFAFELHYEHDILHEEPRFRERGATRFVEQVWFGTFAG
jgi:thiopurine S-methyltransferase